MVQSAHARQEIGAQDRRHRDRGHEARQNRDDVGDAERREQAALDPGEREQRHEHENDDGRGIDDAGAHLLRGAAQ